MGRINKIYHFHIQFRELTRTLGLFWKEVTLSPHATLLYKENWQKVTIKCNIAGIISTQLKLKGGENPLLIDDD